MVAFIPWQRRKAFPLSRTLLHYRAITPSLRRWLDPGRKYSKLSFSLYIWVHLDSFVEGELDKLGVLTDGVEGDEERLAEDGEHRCGRNCLKVEVVFLHLGSIF